MNKESKITKEALAKFIKENYENLTTAEMAGISKWSVYTVSNLCKELGIVPITIRGQNLKRIKEIAHLPLWKICEIIHLDESGVKQYLKELGIKPILTAREPETPKVEKKKKEADYSSLVNRNLLGPIARSFQEREPIDIINSVLYK